MRSHILALLVSCLLLGTKGQRTATISFCRTSDQKKSCIEAFDGVRSQGSNGWVYEHVDSSWGYFNLEEASDVSGVSIRSKKLKYAIKEFSIQCYREDHVVDVTNVKLISGQASSITGNRILMATAHRNIRVYFDRVPGCTGVKLWAFDTFDTDTDRNKLMVSEFSIFTGALGNGCNKNLFHVDEHIWHADLYCWDQADYPQYTTQSSGQPCSTQCKTLDGVESASECHDLVKNSACGASFFAFNPANGRCWAKSNDDDIRVLSGGVMGAIQRSDCVPNDEPEHIWKSCRWESDRDANLAEEEQYIGWTCADNEILTGFGLNVGDEEDVTKIQCCELGGHYSVTDTCTFIDVDDEPQFESEQASCNANEHKVFSGAYDAHLGEVDDFTEIVVGKCCEVECDAPWCNGKDWGVTDQCKTISANLDVDGPQDLVCPEGTLLTQIHDAHGGKALGLQRVESIVCCELDMISQPTKAPTTSPTTTAPSPSPTTAPSPTPTTAPSPAPTTAPSPSPTAAPSSKPSAAGECLLEVVRAACEDDLTDAQILEGLDDCLPDCDVPQEYYRRALEGRLLPENVRRL